MKIHVSSEIGRLNGVIVHTPGKEVSLVSPENKDELLFDDIIFEADAQEEHLAMKRVFEASLPKGGQVIEINDLIRESFEQAEARAYYIEEEIKRFPGYNLVSIEKDLHTLSGRELLEFALWGQTEKLPNILYKPSPNILFTRDLAAVINDGIILSRAATEARGRESILMETIVRYHPLFEAVRERAFSLDEHDSIEGGDILIPSSEVVLVGMSERTSFSGIMKAAEAFFEFGIKEVLIVDIPKKRSSMHLDTIFTFANETECIVYPPAIVERKKNVVRLTKDGDGNTQTQVRSSLHSALSDAFGKEMTFISCGGDEPIYQNREQWTDGANVFALAPGVIVGYERNTRTFKTLEKHGYTSINQYDFEKKCALGEITPGNGEKFAVSFIGNELCRGRGGARCMTLPISRLP